MTSLNEISTSQVWLQIEGIALCVELEAYAAQNNCHVALTGGLLYNVGPRKDCDIVVYRRGLFKGEKELPEFNRTQIETDFANVLTIHESFTRVTKASFKGKPVDILFVHELGSYDGEEDDTSGTPTDKNS